LIDGFAPPSTEPKQGPSMIRDWLSFVYYRIGSLTPLDLAMRSVACMQSGLRKKDTRLINVSRGYYGGALQTLRKALLAPTRGQAELQSTVMLLTFYEVNTEVCFRDSCELTIVSAHVKSKRRRMGATLRRFGRDDANTRSESIRRSKEL
jgi:hypothetical protein